MIYNKLHTLLASSSATIKRYPLVLLSAFAATAFLILSIENEHKYTQSILIKLCLTASLGIGLFFSTKMLTEKVKLNAPTLSKFIPTFYVLVVAILGWFHFFILPEDFKQASIQHTIMSIVFIFVGYISITFSPFVIPQSEEENFWEYNKNIFSNIVFTALFIGVFIIGINLAIVAVGSLFEININEKVHTHFSIFSAIFGSTFIFLSFASEGLSSLEKESAEYPIILKFFTQFILIPLLIVYGIILYLYGIKILFTWNLPKGWVSFMIMAYSSIGIFAYFLVYPLGKSIGKSWVKFFFNIFHYSILPILILLFIAIFTRVLEYGFTENRYFVLAYSIWLTFITFYFIFKKNANIKIIPISLCIFAIISIFSPFLNVFSISKNNQKKELIKILNKTKILKNGTIDFNEKITEKNAKIISDKMEFLAKRNEKEFLYQYINAEYQTKFDKIISEKHYSHYDFKELFTKQEIGKGKYKNLISITIPTPNIFRMEEKYDYLILLEFGAEKHILDNGDYIVFDNGNKITLHSDKKIFEYVFEEKLIPHIKNNMNKEKNEIKPILFQLGKYDFIMFSEIYYTYMDNEIKDISLQHHPKILIKKR